MIARYTRPEMGAIWTEENKLKQWLRVEIAATKALAHFGLVPQKAYNVIRKKAKFNLTRVKQIEDEVKHDVIAFLTNVSESIGPLSRYVHFGLTSSDVLDTALALQVKEASDLLLQDLDELLVALKKRTRQHRYTLMVGRTHGVHAEPTTLGLKLALFYAEFSRHKERLKRASLEMTHGKISGAVGNFAHLDPKIEKYICKELGLEVEPISTQVIQRDRHATYMTTIALIGASLEKLATEIRLLQKTETLEVEESFSEGQKGSSAMPHKKNPITCEKIAGLARVLRGNALASMENVALWHERDITHSSVERIIFPDSTILLDHMLTQMTSIIRYLVVYPEQMMANLEKMRGMVFSQAVLLALVKKGLTREKAYSFVQRAAKRVWNEQMSLRDALKSDRDVSRLLKDREFEEIFHYRYYVKNVNAVLKRVGIV
jgi:adenylosuccinate lyase